MVCLRKIGSARGTPLRHVRGWVLEASPKSPNVRQRLPHGIFRLRRASGVCCERQPACNRREILRGRGTRRRSWQERDWTVSWSTVAPALNRWKSLSDAVSTTGWQLDNPAHLEALSFATNRASVWRCLLQHDGNVLFYHVPQKYSCGQVGLDLLCNAFLFFVRQAEECRQNQI